MKKPQAHFYYMVAAQIMFVNLDEKGEPGSIGSAPVNTVIWTDFDRIPVSGIARAQQMAQMNFLKKVEDPTTVKIVDVILLNLIPLGRFTPEEFNRAPENTQLQQQDKDAIEAILSGKASGTA